MDIPGGLKKITSKLKSGGYSNEYDIQIDIDLLIASSYDGHFNYQSDILGVFVFTRNYSLYSISKDGLSVPEVYALPDLLALSLPDSAKYTPSPVSTVNGQEVDAFMNDLSNSGFNQDPVSSRPLWNCLTLISVLFNL